MATDILVTGAIADGMESPCDVVSCLVGMWKTDEIHLAMGCKVALEGWRNEHSPDAMYCFLGHKHWS